LAAPEGNLQFRVLNYASASHREELNEVRLIASNAIARNRTLEQSNRVRFIQGSINTARQFGI
jgi:uncharacterized protein YfdQ (DUF2303 family)